MQPPSKKARVAAAAAEDQDDIEEFEVEDKKAKGKVVYTTAPGRHAAERPPGPDFTQRSAGDDLLLALVKTKVDRVAAQHQAVVTVQRSEPVTSAFQKLVNGNFLSAPVLNKKGRYYGFVDMLDLVSYVVKLFSNRSEVTLEDVQQLFAKEDQFNAAQVKHIMRYPITKENPFHPMHKGFSLFHAFEILALTDAHRVPVLNAAGQVVKIVTQSMCVKFVHEHIELLGDRRSVTLADLPDPSAHIVVAVTSDQKAIHAFNLMVEKNIGGLPVLEPQTGWLIDNISLRDLRGIRTDAKLFWRLWEPISVFKNKVKQEYQKAPNHVIFALPSDTMESVIEKMAQHHIHRVYMVESTQTRKPIRVVSQRDVLRFVLHSIGSY